MKAAVYNPYLDTLGGGERYTLSFAKVLTKLGYDVFLEWKNNQILEQLEKRFGMDLGGITTVESIEKGKGYDVCFWVSDGSIPLLRANKNILHFQVPFMNVEGMSLLNRMKLFRISKVICNSLFTKRIIDREYGVNSSVIYPPVDIEKIRPRRKQNIILSVGRFSQLLQAKRQDVLISAFKTLVDHGLKKWQLVLAGGSEVGGKEYVVKLKKLAVGYPVDVYENPSYVEITKLFGVSKLYWSASGFGVDEKKEPKKVEHFGIAVVEAMAGESVPLVYNSGGHKETIINGKNGFLWKTRLQLVRNTLKVITDKQLYNSLCGKLVVRSRKFSYERFEREVSNMLSA